MLKKVIRHDLRLLAADKTLWVVAAAVSVGAAYGVFNGVRAAAEGDYNFNIGSGASVETLTKTTGVRGCERKFDFAVLYSF